MWFECVTNVPLTWKQQATMEGSREGADWSLWKQWTLTLMMRSPVWTPARIAAPSTTHTTASEASVRERSIACMTLTYLLSPAAQRLDCLRLQSAQNHFYLSGLSHSAGQDLNTRTHTWECVCGATLGPFTHRKCLLHQVNHFIQTFNTHNCPVACGKNSPKGSDKSRDWNWNRHLKCSQQKTSVAQASI